MTRLRELKAAAVHLLTALGSVCALFAVLAVVERRLELAFFWLGVAFFIDGIDGWFARRVGVKDVLPRISGEVLDLCVDYVTYVFVPALVLALDPGLSAWGVALAALVCVTSLYHFADTASKSDDYCFVGFPAIWNIVVFYVVALGLPVLVSAPLVVACAAMTFVRWKWVHPMRVTAFRGLTLTMTVLWAVTAAAVVWTGFPANWLAASILMAVALYGIGLSLYFSATSQS